MQSAFSTRQISGLDFLSFLFVNQLVLSWAYFFVILPCQTQITANKHITNHLFSNLFPETDNFSKHVASLPIFLKLCPVLCRFAVAQCRSPPFPPPMSVSSQFASWLWSRCQVADAFVMRPPDTHGFRGCHCIGAHELFIAPVQKWHITSNS